MMVAPEAREGTDGLLEPDVGSDEAPRPIGARPSSPAQEILVQLFFSLPSWAVALIVLAVLGAATVAGYATGHYLREHEARLREPFGVIQAALLGVVGLILAFGLTLAVGRYEDRRAATVVEANAIGTSYLRAQLIGEPARSRSLALLRGYADLAIQVSKEIPGSPGMRRT